MTLSALPISMVVMYDVRPPKSSSVLSLRIWYSIAVQYVEHQSACQPWVIDTAIGAGQAERARVLAYDSLPQDSIPKLGLAGKPMLYLSGRAHLVG